ncbi:MAG: type II CRISPR RNA-guided endonuclease Cas9 [Cellvibrionales bacterium]|nr:type II CRISPR RNA-guided endonuclease Cas9 [Cellvibrionales bacterium]
MRTRALDERLDPHELGRVFLHLVQRRGFLSNKKTRLGGEMLDDPDVQAVLAELGDDDADDGADAEETAFKTDIKELRNEIEKSGKRTLGEYLASRNTDEGKRNRQRNGGHLRTDRQMYRDELDKIWQQQAKHHPVLTAAVKGEIEEIIFHQRPLKPPKNIGKCSLETRNKRCKVARLEYQRFRYLQDINNLKYHCPHSEGDIRPAEDPDKHTKMVNIFERKAAPTFAEIRKALGLKRIKFNQEYENSVKKLKGNATACAIREILPEWDGWTEDKRIRLVEDLLTIRKQTALKARLMGHWKFPSKTAVQLCMLEFEPGYGDHSLKAIRKLLPHLEHGKIYSDAREAAGYGYEQQKTLSANRLGPPPEIPNPIVQKGLHELRRVVNAIIAEHGKPDVIRIEMARELEMNTKKYKAFLKQQKANTDANDRAIKAYEAIAKRESGLRMSSHVGKTNKIKYRLWEEQGERCVYSNRPISQTALFSDEVEIDHILPFSQSLDDSYMNKVVCYAKENRYKGNRTPKDAFSGDPAKWGQITSAISGWPKQELKSKHKRFYMTEADILKRDFIGSQLTDTRYISKEAGKYLESLGAEITYTRGAMTAWLRHHWDLNRLISETDKKERTDHRHHAIDAVVTACIDRGFYQALAANAKREERTGVRMRDLITDAPWDDLRSETEDKLNQIIVSHVPQRKISGALHEETGVGFIDGVGTVYRKNLDGNFTQKNAESIIDPVIKERVTQHLKAYGNDSKKAFADNVTVYHKNGRTPIKRVRVVQAKTDEAKLKKNKFGVRNKQGEIFRWMAYGNIHHVEIIRNKKNGKYEGVFVTTMEAAQRARGINSSKEPIIRTNHKEDREFVMAIHINDLVSIKVDGNTQFYRVQKLDRGPKQIKLRLHNAATIKNEAETLTAKESTIPALMKKELRVCKINAIGKLQDDKTHS